MNGLAEQQTGFYAQLARCHCVVRSLGLAANRSSHDNQQPRCSTGVGRQLGITVMPNQPEWLQVDGTSNSIDSEEPPESFKARERWLFPAGHGNQGAQPGKDGLSQKAPQ